MATAMKSRPSRTILHPECRPVPRIVSLPPTSGRHSASPIPRSIPASRSHSTATKTNATTPLYLPPGTATVRARTFDGTNWSALAETTFYVDTLAAAAGNLVISEIMYHPADPSAAEIAAGFNGAGDFEYLELT